VLNNCDYVFCHNRAALSMDTFILKCGLDRVVGQLQKGQAGAGVFTERSAFRKLGRASSESQVPSESWAEHLQRAEPSASREPSKGLQRAVQGPSESRTSAFRELYERLQRAVRAPTESRTSAYREPYQRLQRAVPAPTESRTSAYRELG